MYATRDEIAAFLMMGDADFYEWLIDMRKNLFFWGVSLKGTQSNLDSIEGFTEKEKEIAAANLREALHACARLMLTVEDIASDMLGDSN